MKSNLKILTFALVLGAFCPGAFGKHAKCSHVRKPGSGVHGYPAWGLTSAPRLTAPALNVRRTVIKPWWFVVDDGIR